VGCLFVDCRLNIFGFRNVVWTKNVSTSEVPIGVYCIHTYIYIYIYIDLEVMLQSKTVCSVQAGAVRPEEEAALSLYRSLTLHVSLPFTFPNLCVIC